MRKQPSSTDAWLRLAQFELDRGDPQAALRAVGPALYLDPRSQAVQQLWLASSRAEVQRRAGRREGARGREEEAHEAAAARATTSVRATIARKWSGSRSTLSTCSRRRPSLDLDARESGRLERADERCHVGAHQFDTSSFSSAPGKKRQSAWCS